ncbi:MAG: HD domain-containing phosphohydrolase [Motiliproteus sp.]
MSNPTSAKQTSVSVFEWIDTRHQFLLDTYAELIVTPDRKHISRCLYLAHQIQDACKVNKDGIISALQLNRTPRYQYVKELFAAVLCELLGKQCGLTSSKRLLLICAALTQDIAMLAEQDSTLDKQTTPLTEGQRKFISKHPAASKKILEDAGVKDAIWLSAVEQHHERMDGSGYPNGLLGEQISQAARILSTADTYVAMIRPRADRVTKFPRDALKEVFLVRGDQIDVPLARTLIDTLGIHPPGAWVKLANGEIGVVTGAGLDHPFPNVSVVLSEQGEHLDQAQPRDTSIRRNTIVEIVPAPFHFNLGSILQVIWPQINV